MCHKKCVVKKLNENNNKFESSYWDNTEAISLPGIGKLFACRNFEITEAKGRLISKCLFGVIVWTKKPTRFFPGFLPKPLKRGQIKK